MSSISVTTTAAALLALTTPFQQPTGCDSHFITTSLISTYLDGDTYTVPFIVSERVNSCYPSGWDSVVPESRLCFSPAVCPSGWTYYSMEENRQGASTAYCCDSGYSFVPTEVDIVSDIFSTACGSWISGNEVSVDSDYGITMTVETFVVHEAWAITWMSDDTSTLTPLLPALTDNERLPIWTPDQVTHQATHQATPDVEQERINDNGLDFLGSPLGVIIIPDKEEETREGGFGKGWNWE
ncbi:hypothetical protein FIE12Z_10330 [Fusarium flagelliforme]|uniref:Uncharacterized protein n=1 Tax=Fusarium flagelliforme TaxID=2675880 RepID=A0A395MC45_9HYPO|nr:hypothetical protein FIE12Z_10330 [Fusarium flagelliforme]